MSRHRVAITLALLTLALLSEFLDTAPEAGPAASPSPTPRPVPAGMVRVTEVVDGDTITVDGGWRVRLIGVNTPETVDPRRPVQCFGREASDFTKRTLEGAIVRLERDLTDTDKYGRLLRYVYLDDGTLFNELLVAEGYAQAHAYPPDIAHAAEFQAAQAAARTAGRGLWSACPPAQ